MKNVEATILNMDIMTEFYRLYFTTNAKIKVNIVCVKYSLCRPYRDFYYCYMAIHLFISIQKMFIRMLTFFEGQSPFESILSLSYSAFDGSCFSQAVKYSTA